MTGKKITELTGSISPSITGSTVVAYGGKTYKTTLSTLKQVVVDGQSHYFTGSQKISGSLLVGTGSFHTDNPEILHVENSGSFNLAHFEGNHSAYSQINVKNVNSGSNASTDLVITADNGNENVHFIDLGMNSSTYTGGFVGLANDAYLLNVGKDLYVGTVGGINHPSQLKLFANNSWENPQITISGSGQISFNTSSVSSGFAYEFSGSVKLKNNLNVSGSVTASYFVGDGSQLTNLSSQTVNTGSLATTGSNTFNGNQTINGSLILDNGAVIKDNANNSISFGYQAAETNQGTQSVAIGNGAGGYNQSHGTVAVGANAGALNQEQGTVALGSLAGANTQRQYSIAVGTQAGGTNQGQYSIALGYWAGRTNQASHSIVINATGNDLDNTISSSLKIAPIRNVTGSSGILQYDDTTKEVSYSDTFNGSFTTTEFIQTSTLQGTGSLYLKPDSEDSRYFEIYNTSPSDTHIKGNGGLSYFGDDTNYLKIDDGAGDATLRANSDIRIETGNGDIVLNPDGGVYLGSVTGTNSVITSGYLSGIIGDTEMVNNGSGNTLTDNLNNIINSIPTIPVGTISGSAQITELGFISSSQTGSLATTGSNSFSGNQTINGSVTINVPTGIPSGVSNWNGQGGWNQGSYSDLATTGGTGTGLTVNVAASGGGYIDISAISIHTPGSGYTNGDIITIDNENNLPGTFTLVVGANSFEFNASGSLVFPDSTIQTTAYVGTPTYISSGPTAPGSSVVANNNDVDINFAMSGTQHSFALSGMTTNGFTVLTSVTSSFDNDTAAAAAGVPLQGLYRSGSYILIRLT